MKGSIFDSFDFNIHLSINSEEVFGFGVTIIPT